MGEPKAELLSFQQLRCFCATADLGSFTAAADALRVSQPAVATQVRRLEQLLGADLFARAGRGVRLTPAGEAFAEHAYATLATLDDAAASVGSVLALRSGTVTVGTFNWPAPWRLEEVVGRFAADYPGIRVRLVGRNSSVTADRVRRGELEGAIVVLPIDDDGLDVRPIARDEVVYASAEPSRIRSAVSIERFAEAPLVFYDAEAANEDPIRRQLAERAQAAGVALAPRVEVEDVETALQLVAAGVGDTYLQSAFLHMAAFPPNVSTAPFRPALHDTFAIITRRTGRLSPATRTLLAAIESHMERVTEQLDRLR